MLLGTVCMINDTNGKKLKDSTIGTITQRSMLNLINVAEITDLTPDMVQAGKRVLQAKLESKVKQNIQALATMLKHIATMPSECRLFRISSNLLPLFDHPLFSALYDDKLLSIVDRGLASCKFIIDRYDIRVCTHPDQYTVINSDKAEVRQKAYTALMCHKYFMERLTTADRTSINIHLNGKLDHLPELDQGLYSDLVPWLSFENEDKKGTVFVASTANTLKVCERYGIKMLFDLHHHYALEGEQLSINDPMVARIVRTWGDSKPLFHLSQGKDAPTDKKHSDFITDASLITYAKQFLVLGDMELEAKAKNLAVLDFHTKVY